MPLPPQGSTHTAFCMKYSCQDALEWSLQLPVGSQQNFFRMKGSQHCQVGSAGTGAARLGLVRDQSWDGSGHQETAMKGWDPCDFSSYSKLPQSPPHHSLLLTDQANLSFVHIYKIYNKHTPKIKKGLILLPRKQCLKQQMDCGCSTSIYSLFRPLISFALKTSGFWCSGEKTTWPKTSLNYRFIF